MTPTRRLALLAPCPERVPTMYDAMPEPGTAEQCSFCRTWVTLRRAETGWHYWTADGEPVDGRQRCYGGVTPRKLRTYHVPFPTKSGDRRAVRYDPDRRPHPAQREGLTQVKLNGKPLKTAEETVAALIEEHERRKFWEAMDAIDPDEYEAQSREEGAWPTEGEYAAEERMVRAQETTA